MPGEDTLAAHDVGPAPMVSVVIPAFNAAATIAETLDSVIGQSYRPIEVVVVNDGSTDGTADVLASFGDRIRVVDQPNAGLACARNAGLAVARGEFVALMDADDICLAGRIAVQMAYLRSMPDVDLCASDFSAFDAHGARHRSYIASYYSAVGSAPGGISSLFDESRRMPRPDGLDPIDEYPAGFETCSGRIRDRLVFGNFLHPPTVLFRRALLARVGTFDAGLRNLCDYDWLLRVSRVARIGYIDWPLIRYRLWPGQMSGDRNTVQVKLDTVRILHELKASDPEFYAAHARRLDRRVSRMHFGIADVLAGEDRRRAWRHAAFGVKRGFPTIPGPRLMAKLILPGRAVAWLRGLRRRPAPASGCAMEFAPIFKGVVRVLASMGIGSGDMRAGNGGSDKGERHWGKGDLASYGYGLWLKHLTLLHGCGMHFPESVAEVGPGDSLGLGIAALLSGVKTYHAYDVRPFASPRHNAALVDDLADMLRRRKGRPVKGWPDFDSSLDATLFPSTVLTPAWLDEALAPPQIEEVRRLVAEWSGEEEARLRYRAPWEPEGAPAGRYDLIVTHSVLEYVEDPAGFVRSLARMLRPGGWMSHQVDLSSLAITRRWNGHLAYPDWLWAIVTGGSAWRPNRQLEHDYLRAMDAGGLEVVRCLRACRPDGLRRSRVARKFREFPPEEVSCHALYIIVRLPPVGGACAGPEASENVP